MCFGEFASYSFTRRFAGHLAPASHSDTHAEAPGFPESQPGTESTPAKDMFALDAPAGVMPVELVSLLVVRERCSGILTPPGSSSAFIDAEASCSVLPVIEQRS